MNLQVFIDWYTNGLYHELKGIVNKKVEQEKFCWFVYDAPSHPSEAMLNEIESCFRVIFLPPNVTALLQPMDQDLMEKLKRL